MILKRVKRAGHILDVAKRLIAASQLSRIGQTESLLTLIQVYEVHVAKVTELIHDEPSIVLRHGHLIEFHVF